MGTVDLFPSFFPKKPLFLNGGRYIVVTKTVGRELHQCRKIITSYLKDASLLGASALFEKQYLPISIINN